jgi:hypothetical protein
MQSNKRSDLMVTVAALLVTVAVGYLQFYYERYDRAQRAGMQGINLLYLSGGMHWNQLDSASRHKIILTMLKRGPANAAFMDTAAS